jgi:glycosyltransferase involved in cell wall biosynthesis
MCLVPISLTDVKAKGVFSHILQRDLNGYFDKVFSIHFPSDKSQLVEVNERHSIWEFSGRHFSSLGQYPLTNMVLSELRLLVSLSRFLRQTGVCIIKAQDPYIQGLNGFVLSRCSGASFVTLVVSNYDLSYQSAKMLAYPQLRFHWLEKALARFVFRQSDLVLAMSENNRDFAIRNGASAAIARTVRSGAAPAPEHFQPLTVRRNLKSELGVEDKKVVLFVGRLSPEKYPQDVVHCANAMQTVTGGDDVVFLLAGEGPMREGLEHLIADKRLWQRVRLLGAQSQRQIMDLCFTADVIIAPLSGISLIEAALAATPIVAYDVEWHGELVHDRKTGLLVPFRNVDRLTEAVRWVLGHPNEASRMGDAARQLALRQHDIGNLLRDEMESYDSLIAS